MADIAPGSDQVAELQALLSRLVVAEQAPGHALDADHVGLLERLLGKFACRRLGIYALPEGWRLSVVIPVYNEVRTVAEVVKRVRDCGLPVEIILIDDGSTDGTRGLLDAWRGESDLRIIFHEKNQGKGAALRTGFREATGDVVIVQDADLEYDPAEFPMLVQPIVEGSADAVFGSRFLGEDHRVLYFWHSIGNSFLTLFSNMMTNLNLTDMETCYKAFRRDVIQQIAPRLRENRFGIEPELTAKVARLPGVRIFERPVSYQGRTYAEGKKITWRDGFRALWCIVRYRNG
ncbi:MAG TPA: glycosyltransferase family 2 protein [Pirellulales bacterium]|nr:glycosyltransferase family 2 protein [Pirellulales bacterium]